MPQPAVKVPGGTVLVVDDSSTMRSHVAMLLAEAGFSVRQASDGDIAADILASDESIILVLLDVHMPRKNGLVLLDELREAPGRDRYHVLMLTTESHPTLLRRARDAGARGWMVKPLRPDLLVMAVRTVLERGRPEGSGPFIPAEGTRS